MEIIKQHNGSYLITDIIDGQYIKQVYYQYTKKESIKLFKQLTNKLTKNNEAKSFI